MDRNDFSPGSAWGIVPEKFEALLRQFRDLQADAGLLKEAAAFAPEGIDGPSYRVADGVAVIDIKGPVTERMSFFAWLYGAANLPRVRFDLAAAVDDPQVRAIVLDIDSPGGVISGVDETARAVAAANKVKPVTAYTGGMMASAAYWIGSAAGDVVAGRTAELGSIGVFMVHEDWTKFDERYGITTTVIKAGKYKALHLEPLTKETKAVLQAEVDAIHDIFIASVAEGRGVDAKAVRERMADGRVFIGQDAVDTGLADRLSSIDDVIASAAPDGAADFSFATAAATSSAANDKETIMKFETVAQLEEAFPELVNQIREAAIASVDVSAARDEGHQAGVSEATQAERDRVTAILEADGDHDVTMAAIKDGTAASDVFKAFYQAEKKKRADGLADLEAGATPPQGQDTDTDEVVTGTPDQQLVAKAKELMAADASLTIDKALAKVQAEDKTLAGQYRSQYTVN
mgnify:CR=1 FL=1